MSENKFKVPAKSAPAKKEVSEAKAKDVKKTATKKSSSASSTKKSTTKKPPQSESVKKQVKSESPKKRVESSSTKAKKSSNLTFEKQELPKNNPNLGNYTLEERIAILNGSDKNILGATNVPFGTRTLIKWYPAGKPKENGTSQI